LAKLGIVVRKYILSDGDAGNDEEQRQAASIATSE
jgi:hypothetical protein